MPQSLRTVLLWVAMIVMFVVIYQVFGRPSGAEPTRWLTVFTRLLPIVFLVLFTAFFFIARKRQSPHQEGVRLLQQGRYLHALEQFELFRKAQPQQAVGA